MTEMTQIIVIKKIIAMVNKSGDMKLCLESDKSSMIVKNKSATIAVFIKKKLAFNYITFSGVFLTICIKS